MLAVLSSKYHSFSMYMLDFKRPTFVMNVVQFCMNWWLFADLDFIKQEVSVFMQNIPD